MGVASLGAITCGHDQSRPNVVFILADDLGYGDVSAFNPESKIHTGNLDALASNGIIFTDAHSASSLSTPSRYAIMTGRYPWRTTMKKGVGKGYSGPLITEGRSTIASMLSEEGYNTACIGKWHLGWDWTLKDDAESETDVDFTKPIRNGVTDRGGFDYFYGIPASLDMPPYVYVENDMATAVPDSISGSSRGMTLFRSGPIARTFDPAQCLERWFDKAIEYVDSQKGSKDPFFLYLPLTAPHTPILPTEEYNGKTIIGPYGDFVVMIDDLVGKLVSRLKENKQWDNTIFVFTSDNGCAAYIKTKDMERMGHYPRYVFRGYKNDIYEGGHRIPLIVSWGDKYKNVKDNSLVCLSDFYATFAEMTGHVLRDDEAVDSYSLWGNLSGKGRTARRDLVSLSGQGRFALRDVDLKLIFWPGSGGQAFPNTPEDMAGLPEKQLYNLGEDVGERVNLVEDASYDGIVKELTLRMRRYVDEGRSTPGASQKNDTGNHWEQTEQF